MAWRLGIGSGPEPGSLTLDRGANPAPQTPSHRPLLPPDVRLVTLFRPEIVFHCLEGGGALINTRRKGYVT